MPKKTIDNGLDFTGERMLPGKVNDWLFLEHIYRYRFAKNFVNNKNVLDIACGEGYGSAGLLLSGAKKIVGVDIDKSTCSHAARRYQLNIINGDATNIPIQSKSFDIVISFETIEHLNNPSTFLSECSRLLKPQGILIISTPNKELYDVYGDNPYHRSELSEEAFLGLVSKHFNCIGLYSQCLHYVSWWSLRPFSALEPVINRIKGYNRVIYLLRKFFRPELVSTHSTVSIQQDPDKYINQDENVFVQYINPLIVRKKNNFDREKSKYMIVVARNKN